MEKIKKQRMIILITLILVVVISLIFSSVNRGMSYAFKAWVFHDYGIGTPDSNNKILEPTLWPVISIIVIICVVWLLFVGLAFLYAKSNSPKVQARKWPYIVLLVFAAITVCITIYGLTQPNHGMITLDKTIPEDTRNIINDKLNGEYAIVLISKVISGVADVSVIALTILALIWISKIKASKDMQMTNEVIQAGFEQNQPENDLP